MSGSELSWHTNPVIEYNDCPMPQIIDVNFESVVSLRSLFVNVEVDFDVVTRGLMVE